MNAMWKGFRDRTRVSEILTLNLHPTFRLLSSLCPEGADNGSHAADGDGVWGGRQAPLMLLRQGSCHLASSTVAVRTQLSV